MNARIGAELRSEVRVAGATYFGVFFWNLERRPVEVCREVAMSDINKVVLAYSGGLDTSVIAKWLQTTYHCEVVTFTAYIGQGEDV